MPAFKSQGPSAGRWFSILPLVFCCSTYLSYDAMQGVLVGEVILLTQMQRVYRLHLPACPWLAAWECRLGQDPVSGTFGLRRKTGLGSLRRFVMRHCPAFPGLQCSLRTAIEKCWNDPRIVILAIGCFCFPYSRPSRAWCGKERHGAWIVPVCCSGSPSWPTFHVDGQRCYEHMLDPVSLCIRTCCLMALSKVCCSVGAGCCNSCQLCI